MQDVGLQDSAAFDAAVVRLEGLRMTAIEERFAAEVGLGQGAELVTELTDLVAAHPLRERLAAALMRALAAAGRDSEALLVHQREEALADALGVGPSPELAALHVALLRGELGRKEPGRQEARRKTNLRAELTTFVGRGADVAAVRGLVAEHRLTTVTGPGGAGKTRLATETARTLLGELPDGAWLVELAAIGTDDDVAQATLVGLGLRDALLGGAPSAELTDRLIAAVREREALLILDNCEHVVESAARSPPGAGSAGAADPGDEQGTARHHRGGAVAGRATGPAGERTRARARSRPHRPSGCCGTGPGRCARISRPMPGPRRRRRASAGAGRDPAGDRTGRGQAAHHVHPSARRPARRPVPPVDRG